MVGDRAPGAAMFVCLPRLDPPSHASMNDRTDVSELIRVLLCFAFVCVCAHVLASRQLAAHSSPKEQSTSSVCTTSSVSFCGGTATANFRVSRPALGLRAGGVFAAGCALFAVECKVAPWMSLDVVGWLHIRIVLQVEKAPDHC